ncbi:12330_t:CDS:2 [Funneliformis geosporum]|uniref:12330_t:CDS:1 n=1 Tax=Funneliformis geosporum TaxID=1117311 RepID=A0A9W4SND5_9GLOM|nr:12330_t:CDS:2 [Funneliformis geosporum]
MDSWFIEKNVEEKTCKTDDQRRIHVSETYELTSCIEQNHNFQENLEILKPKDPVGSLSIYDEYFNKEYQTFRLLSTEMEEGAAYGSESFPSSFLGLLRKNVILQQEI